MYSKQSQDARSSWNRQLGQPEKPYPNKGVAKLGWLLGVCVHEILESSCFVAKTEHTGEEKTRVTNHIGIECLI